ncbi:FkbM family methyltransferase [Mesorhizobium sp. AR02]|uniref:FkbM family methyltransferase n=1 Tax=Mesorhizobium sp. AR02 TaxID=2865837 RepID=UPI00215E8E25|nr:FkbM family methyltransferase [Mesorhizobium sp. AR02]UVK53904.1 FkbM family methyltransferase [Mesorhizobium sp. AR02]
MGADATPSPAAPAMISYAQNCEDVLLERVFKDAATGFYIDIGAYHPTIGSVTKTFYDRGWSGINVEPGAVFNELARERPRDTNVRAVVTDQEGEVDFFENQSDPGMSKVAEGPVMADGEGEMLRVLAVTLDSLVAQHAIGQEINFLKIDAEGSEAAIIRATDWSLIRPLVLVIEATAPWSNELVNQNWEPVLLANRFLRAYFDGINVFYVRAESKELLRHFQVPVNVLDGHLTFEQWHSGVAVKQLTAERSEIIAQRDQFSAECEAQRQKSAEIQGRSVELTAAVERAEAESQRLTVHAAALSRRLAREQKQAEAERKRLTGQAAALSTQLEQEQQQAGAEGMRLTTQAAALSKQLEQERERAEEDGRRLTAHVAALSRQLEQERHSLASATSLAARYDRLVLELRDEGGPRALRSVLPLARLLRRFHHAVDRDNAIDITPTESSMVSPASYEPPSSPVPGPLRSTVKKGALGVYKVLFRPFVRPVMWRLRTFLLQPVYERLDRSHETLHHARSNDIQVLRQEQAQLARNLENHARSDDIQALRQEQAQLARSLDNHARSDDIQALRQEQAQLVRSLEALALTIATNPPRGR